MVEAQCGKRSGSSIFSVIWKLAQGSLMSLRRTPHLVENSEEIYKIRFAKLDQPKVGPIGSDHMDSNWNTPQQYRRRNPKLQITHPNTIVISPFSASILNYSDEIEFQCQSQHNDHNENKNQKPIQTAQFPNQSQNQNKQQSTILKNRILVIESINDDHSNINDKIDDINDCNNKAINNKRKRRPSILDIIDKIVLPVISDTSSSKSSSHTKIYHPSQHKQNDQIIDNNVVNEIFCHQKNQQLNVLIQKHQKDSQLAQKQSQIQNGNHIYKQNENHSDNNNNNKLANQYIDNNKTIADNNQAKKIVSYNPFTDDSRATNIISLNDLIKASQQRLSSRNNSGQSFQLSQQMIKSNQKTLPLNNDLLRSNDGSNYFQPSMSNATIQHNNDKLLCYSAQQAFKNKAQPNQGQYLPQKINQYPIYSPCLQTGFQKLNNIFESNMHNTFNNDNQSLKLTQLTSNPFITTQNSLISSHIFDTQRKKPRSRHKGPQRVQ